MKFLRRASRVFTLSLLVVIALGAIGGGIAYWRRDALGSWLRNRAIALYLKQIAPDLPFKIESFEIREGSWKDFMNWKIPEIAVTLRRDEFRVQIVGPFEIKKSQAESVRPGSKVSTEVNATLKGKVTIQRLGAQPFTLPPLTLYSSARIHVSGAVKTLDDLADVHEAKIALRSEEKVSVPQLGIDVEKPFFRIDWVAPEGAVKPRSSKYATAEEGTALLQVQAQSVSWTSSTSRAVSLSQLAFEARMPLEMKPGEKPPVALGPEGSFSFRAKSGEALWDEAYLDIPWSDLPIDGKIRLSGFALESGSVSLGPEKAGLNVTTHFEGLALKNPQWTSRGEWKLADGIALLQKATSGSTGPLAVLGDLRQFKFKKGVVKARGSFHDGRIELSNVDLDWPKNAVAIRGLSTEVNLNDTTGAKGWVSLAGLYVKKIKASLGKTPFEASARGLPLQKFQIQIGDKKILPLEIAGVPLHLGSLQGRVDLNAPQSEDFNGGFYFELFSHLEMPPIGVERLAPKVCLPMSKLPPAVLSVRFPELEISSNAIDLTGQVRLDLFDGSITLDDIGLYDLFSDVPETDFNLNIRGVHLEAFGNWAGFGEIDGTLEGYAHDVVIQSWLPTHFDFRAELKPHNHSDVVFSPEAMENFIRLVADDAMDQLPGIAHWFFFGWPATLFNGYDVDYAGISLFSQDGNILLETLDPPDFLRQGKHFILKGKRFNMPLKSSQYPLIVDNTAMGNFFRQRAQVLIDLAETKRLEREQKQGKPNEPQDSSQSTCVPDVFLEP